MMADALTSEPQTGQEQHSEADYRTIFDTANDAIILHDLQDGHILDVNTKMTDMYGYTVDEARHLDVEAVSDGRPPYSQNEARQWIEKAAQGSPQLFEWKARDKQGRVFWVEVNLKRITLRKQDCLLAIVRDISERKETEHRLRDRLRHEEALALCSRDLLKGGGKVISRAIEHLIEPSRVGRVYVFENFEDPAGRICMRQTHEAVREGVTPQLHNPDLQSLPYFSGGFDRWHRSLARGEPIHGPVASFPEAERALLETQGIVSILIIPIQVGGSWWGFIGFDDLNTEREWRPEEIRLLRVTAELIGSHIGHEQMDKTLQANEKRFARMLGVVPDMISIHDTDMTILYSNWQGFAAVPENRRRVNTKCYQTYRGYADICPDCRAREVIAGRRAFQEEVKLEDGTWLDLRVIPFLDEQGRVEMFMEWVRDITDRKQAEEALRESEQGFRTLFTEAPDAIFIETLDDRIMDANPAATRMLGYTREEFRAMSVPDLQAPAVRGTAGSVVRRELEQSSFIEGLDRHKDGRLVAVEVHNRLISLKGEDVVLSVVRDVTERRQVEEQLRQAQKMESVGRLAGGVAHDFNNMLGVILGHSELVMDRLGAQDPSRHDLQEINTAARRSADLTRQLLAYARRQTAAPVVLNLNDTVAGMLTMLRRLIGEDIDLAWMPGRALWPVKIDPAQVDQILANLCVNARDAIQGVGTISIETENIIIDEAYCAVHAGFFSGEFALLSVSDDGRGMDAETREHLFEPFYTTKDIGQGTGLGLATVYGIVKQNKGFINVYSEPGQGSTFKIFLPKSEEVLDSRESGKDGPVTKGSETVLLVEDEPSILNLGKTILENYGYTVLAAETPLKALALVRQQQGPLHLLITDVVMPEMNGKELKGRLEALRSDVKVLYMSGYTANVIMHRGILEHDVHFLQKPFTVQALAGKVREVLDGVG